MKKNILILTVVVLISFVILFILYLSQDGLKHGFIINKTKYTIKDKIEIELENFGVKSVNDIESGDIVKFGKSTFLNVRKIKSIKINDKTITNFDSTVKINDSLNLTFVQGKDVHAKLVDLGVVGMFFTSQTGLVTPKKLLCINTSMWVLPVYGYVRNSDEEGSLIAFPLTRDVEVYEVNNPENVKSLKIIDIGLIFCDNALIDQVNHGGEGPNAVIGIEIGDPLTSLLTKIVYLIISLIYFLSSILHILTSWF